MKYCSKGVDKDPCLTLVFSVFMQGAYLDATFSRANVQCSLSFYIILLKYSHFTQSELESSLSVSIMK